MLSSVIVILVLGEGNGIHPRYHHTHHILFEQPLTNCHWWVCGYQHTPHQVRTCGNQYHLPQLCLGPMWAQQHEENSVALETSDYGDDPIEELTDDDIDNNDIHSGEVSDTQEK